MRILHVAHSFLPHSHGGVETYLYHLTQAQASEHQVAVFHPILSGQQSRYTLTTATFGGIPTYAVEMGGAPRQPFAELYDGPLLNRLTQVVQAFQPEVIHYHSLINLCMALLAPELSVAKVFTAHDLWLLCPRVFMLRTDDSLCQSPEGGLLCVTCQDPAHPPPARPPTWGERLQALRRRLVSYNFAAMQLHDQIFQQQFRQTFAREKAREVNQWVMLSRLYQTLHQRWGIAPEQIHHLPLGTPTAAEAANRASIRQTAGPVRFGFIGRVERLKGVEVLLAAFNQVSAANAELRLYGQFTPAAYERRVRALAQRANVQFLGPFPPAHLPQVLQEIDVLVLPSIVYENCPMVILEARAAGIPAIVSNIGGAAELITPGQTGWHFARGDATALAAVLNTLATQPEQINAMRRTLPPVKTMAQNAQELLGVYCAAQATYAQHHT